MAEEARGLWGNPPDNALRDEALTLYRAFEVMVIGELAAFRWESWVSPIREGLRGAIVPVPTWHMARIRIEASTATVIRNDTPLLGGLLLRPVAPHRHPRRRSRLNGDRFHPTGAAHLLPGPLFCPKPPPAQPRGSAKCRHAH
jgi:hypothetical protein